MRLALPSLRVPFSPGQWGIWLLLALVMRGVLPLQAATFTAALDRNTIAVGESATLSLTFEGGTPERLPTFQGQAGLSIQSLGQSRQFTMVNGRTTSSVSYNYQVTATRPGDYVIPAIQVEMDQQILSSRPLRLRVTASSPQTGLAFLKLIPSKETVYVGEVFPVEVQLYLGVRQDSLQLPQLEGDGFTFGKVAAPTQSATQVGNQMYTVGTFRVAVTPVKTGQLILGPARCSLVLHVPIAKSRSVFDDFFGGGVQRKPITLSSEPQAITVLPLPAENRPPQFNGAVGSFSLSVSASPTNVTTGDPITLMVQIAGRGNLDTLPFPAGEDWPGFKLYAPASKTEVQDALGMEGLKTFERVVIPQKPDLTQIPQIEFSFFDPEQKSYRTLRQGPLSISVRPSQLGQPQPTVLAGAPAGEETGAAARDIVHIKPYPGTIGAVQPPLITRPWFLAVQALPVLLWFGAFVWRKRRESLANNPRLRRRIAVSETVRAGLKNLSRLAEARDSEGFFASVFRLLQEQLGERLDQPSSAITEAVLDERMQGHAPQELIAQVHELFQLCNQVRYAPQRSSQELMDLVPTVEAALRQLRDLPDLPASR